MERKIQMINHVTGSISAVDTHITIVTAEFNSVISESLTHGAIDAFLFHGGIEENLSVIRVPGAFEIPGTVQRVLKFQNPDAVVTLGAVIRGGTPHFDFVAGESAQGIAELSRQFDVPVVFGILTTDNFEQALERAGTKSSNKGWEVMESALKMISVYRQLTPTH